MSGNTAFAGSVPQFYDANLGPVIFEPYAEEVIRYLPQTSGLKVLEIAAGTGRVTRHLVQSLPDAEITVTDLNADMLEIARERVGDTNRLRWQVADALELPFPGNEFDCVLCQFGVMFYPDKLQGHKEALRVLKPGGTYVFSVWDSHDANPWAARVHKLMQDEFSIDPPVFMAVPFSYSDQTMMRSCLEEAGFKDIEIQAVRKDVEATTAEDYARGSIFGTPLSSAITERGVTNLEPVVQKAAAVFRQEFGDAPMRSSVQAIIATAKKP